MSSEVVDIFFWESTERCHIRIEKNSYETDEKKYEWVRRLDARMKVMNECQIGLCWGIWESLGGQPLVIFYKYI